MSTQAIICPSCAASGATGPDSHGEYRCVYCGTRFHRSGPPAPAQAQTQAQPQPGSAVVVIVVLLLFVLVGVGALVASRSGSEDSAAASEPSSRRAAPSGAANADQPATASFEFHALEPGYQASFYALGIVTNTSAVTIDKPKITAVLFDAKGDEVGTSVGYAARDKLDPGQRSPVKILIKDPPDHDSIRYEVVARRSTWTPEMVAGLRVEASEPKPASYGKHRWEIAGKVHNEGSQRARFVSIEIQAFDADGKLIGLGSSYADGETLAPNSNARWSTSVTAGGSVDRFEYAVTGQLAD